MSNIQPDDVVYEQVVPVEEVVVPVATPPARPVAVFTPQRTNTPHLGSKVGLAALSALTGGVLTWAALHAAGWGTPEVVAAPPTGGPSQAGSLHDGVFTGGTHAVADVGELNVVVTVAGGRITDIHTTYPDSGLSGTINQDAVPRLVADAIESQQANVMMVTGATATSTAFRSSLQDAINQSMGAGGGVIAAPVTPIAGMQDGTFTGPTVDVASGDRKYGELVTTITVAGGQITDIQATYPGQGPDESGHSLEINNAAVPQLIDEAKAGQTYDVAQVSGATFTTHAFRESLQGAMSAALLGEAGHAAPATPAAPASPAAPAEPAAPIAGLHDGTFTSTGTYTSEGGRDYVVTTEMTVTGGRITGINVTQMPGIDAEGNITNETSHEASEMAVTHAIPEALELQHSGITMVSGATYTSTAFQHSLQGAILASVANSQVTAPEEVFTGETVDVQNTEGRVYGQITVTIGVENGQITFITATYPDAAGPSRNINYAAVPELIAEAKEQQNADLTMITGATFTTGAFKQSLQDALNQAHL